ncbi:hypothetical protein GCM10027568_01680 [Humibacter soli]
MTIDIMMPFYGDPALFRQAVDSVLAQTSPDWRLTVIDDCYPDPAPGEWMRSIDDPRVTYVRNSENLGVTGNFQRSIDLSSADHVVIMGCDDLMLPNYVDELDKAISRFPNGSYYQPGVDVIDANGKSVLPLADRLKAVLRPKIADIAELRGESLAVGLLHGDWAYFPSICWRRTELVSRGFRPEFEVSLDLALQMEILMDGGSLVLYSATTFQYRRHSASVSSWTASNGDRFEEEAAVFAETAANADRIGWKRAARAARVHVTSRLHALTNLPGALVQRDRPGIRTLLAHTFR